MAFRKRNIAVRTAGTQGDAVLPSTNAITPRHAPGVRPSLSSSASVTSTGTAELDGLLGGHGGLALGSSLLIGEHGTTDYAGALLRAFVSEGLCHGHEIHLVGVDKSWTQNLPGVAIERASRSQSEASKSAEEKMKIAWRYENLGRVGEKGLPSRGVPASSTTSFAEAEVPFCHTFDLTRRLDPSPSHKIHYLTPGAGVDPFSDIVKTLTSRLAAASLGSVHRVAVPLLLSPAYYPPSASLPQNVLRFVHALRALVKKHSGQVTAMISLPLTLYPRSTVLTRTIEHLCDGVIELLPFPYIAGATISVTGGKKDAAQGMLQVLKLPLTTERGEGGAGSGNTIGHDLAFTLSRKKFVIEPFSLPPMEGDQEAQAEAGKITAKDVEF